MSQSESGLRLGAALEDGAHGVGHVPGVAVDVVLLSLAELLDTNSAAALILININVLLITI